MWNSSEYDTSYGGGGGGGGGFMANETGGGAGGGADGARRQRLNNLMPVTCAEALVASQDDDVFRSPLGMALSQVSVVGVITRVDKSATRCDYDLEDGSGAPLEVRVFIDSDADPVYAEGTFVRCCGHLRAMAGKRTVSAFKLTPISDYNDVTRHMLEVLESHMVHQKSHQASSAPAFTGLGAPTPAAGIGGGGGGAIISGLTPMQSQLQHIIRSCAAVEGADISQIRTAMGGAVTEKQLRDTLDFLQNEGYCYSTVDEDHFKSTDG